MDEKRFLEIERTFHDRYSATLDWNEPISDFMSYEQADVPPVEKYFQQILGNIEGKRLLDIGSGHGNCALNLARKGAIVISIDISPNLISGCKKRAAVNKLCVDFHVMDACKLEFGDETFDLIVAFRTIHHLPDIHHFYLEAHRVLKRKGVIILVEPQKYNPFVEFGRRFIRNKETDRTPTEHPFVPSDIHLFYKVFDDVEKREFEFLVVSCEVFRAIINLPSVYRLLSKALTFMDNILWHIPILRPLYWQVVLKATKE